ncbi:GPW/gp25 family protein [Endozoicomonadaceae bacterium StTr2]
MADLLQALSPEWPMISDDPERNAIAVHLLQLLSSRKPLFAPELLVQQQLFLPELNYSLCHFGVANLQSLRNSQQLQDYCHELEQLVCTFEPRIADALVSLLPGDGRDNTLQLKIRITLADTRRQLNLETRIRLDTGDCRFREAGRD